MAGGDFNDAGWEPLTWCITGVSSGLGRALAMSALSRGDRVIGTVRSAEAVAAFSRLAPGRSLGILLDLTRHDAIADAVAAAEAFGTIDILVNNAGYGLIGGIEEVSIEEMREQFETNVFGTAAMIQAVLPYMRARGAGRIVIVSSVSGLVGWPSLGVYSASKFALEGLGETLALEVGALGIKVTLVEPGGMRTDFGTRSSKSTRRRLAAYDATVGESRRILAEHSGQELGDPGKAAAAILAVVDSPAPPLRLILGSDALHYVADKLAAQQAEIDQWRALSRTTDIIER